VSSSGIRDRTNHFLSVAEEKEILRRRDRKIPDPAREREMRELCARLDAMETTQRRTIDVGDINEVESENEAGNEEVVVEDAAEDRLFRVFARIDARAKMDIPLYDGNLDVEELLD
jgi:chromatin segregation and condensation protein Rec8/ScpA/Scc1 (kleisin family)